MPLKYIIMNHIVFNLVEIYKNHPQIKLNVLAIKARELIYIVRLVSYFFVRGPRLRILFFIKYLVSFF